MSGAELYMWEPPESRPERVLRSGDHWWSIDTHRTVDAAGDNPRPLVVIDPEDREQVVSLVERFFMEHVSTDHGYNGMQAALRSLATLPTRDEPQPEPLDPGVRVRDRHGDLWARFSDEFWASPGVPPRSWANLRGAFGPLAIIPPAPEPTPDERPFKVGDLVRVATRPQTARGGFVDPDFGRQICVVIEAVDHSGDVRVRWGGVKQWIGKRHLTHTDADAPC